MTRDIDPFDAAMMVGQKEREERLERLSKAEITNGAELMQKRFKEPEYLWDSVLPDSGLAVMAASKASGKTMILLQLADAIAKGRDYLGLPTQRAKVLFLELELSARRTQQRLLKMGITPDSNLHFAFRWTPGQEGLQLITDAVRENSYKLVIVDVLQLLWPMNADTNSYQDVYSVLAPLRQLANELNTMIILVTHRRKAETADYLDGTIGSVGIQANADVIFSLLRTRGEDEAILYIDGNDIESKKIALCFNADRLGFSLSDASPEEIGQTPERRAIMDAIRELGGTAKPSQLAPIIGKDEKAVSYLCRKLCDAGVIIKTQFGTYTIPQVPHEPREVHEMTDTNEVPREVHEPHEVVDSDETSRTSRTSRTTSEAGQDDGIKTLNTTKAEWPATTPPDNEGLFDTNEVFDDDVSTETLAIVARVFSELTKTNKEGLCIANWRLSCMAEGVSFEAFDEAKKEYDKLGVYVQDGGVVRLKA
jgi:replicative DNA helicase